MLDGMPPISAFEFRMVDLKGDGEIAYMRAAWSYILAPPGVAPISDSGKILVVFRKQPDGTWLRVADAWNSDLPPKQ
jgi:ketosteroid isomerase-like protein